MGMTDETTNKVNTELESEGIIKRELQGFWERVVFIIGIAMSLFHIYFLAVKPITPWLLYTAHLGFGIVLTFLLYPGARKSSKNSIHIIDLILIVAGISASIYIAVEMEGLIYRIGISPTMWDIAASLTIILLVLEMTRRTTGMILPSIAAIFLLYARFGNYIPGLLGHRGYNWPKIISYMIGLDAIYSVPLGASASFVFLFILFSAFLNSSGAGKFFIDFSLGLTGSTRGGPAKTAVVASALFGTVSGNSAANVVSTGAFTIPLMKSIGYKPKFAGAVEAVASTGGQIMPPILGSAAFILAQLVGIPYLRVVTASIIPAILYFLTVFIMIDLEAIKLDLKGLPKEQLPNLKQVITKRGHLILPIFVLMYVLVVLKASPIKAAVWAIISTIVVTSIRRETRMGLGKICNGLSQGANSALGMIAACATAGIVIGVLNLTGTGLKFAGAVISLSGGLLPLALVLTMSASIILGMGLPTTASYLICAAVIAPALVQMGVSNLAAHMFVFYFACISAITPPVALAAYAGAGIAKAKPFEVALIACKLGITAFIVPFLFIYGPPLLWEGSAGSIALSTFTSIIGVSALACGIQNRVFHLRINMIERILLVVSAISLIKPGILTDILGFGLFTIVVVLAFIKNRKKQGVLFVKIAIIGAGNGGQTAAAHLSLEGHETRLYDIDKGKIERIQELGGVQLTNYLEGFGRVSAYINIQDAVKGADVILITTTSPAHKHVAESLVHTIEDGQSILMMPGYWGSVEVKNIFDKHGINKDVIIGEAEILVYTCRSAEPGKVNLRSIKKEVEIAAFPACKTPQLVERIKPIYPGVKPAKSVLETSLNNVNPIFHPAITLFNAGRIEAAGEFFFYPDGVTPRIANFIQKLDNERMKIGEALGLKLASSQDLLGRFYGVDKETIYDGIQSNPAYKTGKAPTTLEYRYIYEDFPYGLIPLSELGKAVGVETTHIDKLIEIVCLFMDKDLYSGALTLESLGLAGMNAEQIKEYFYSQNVA